jgi:hypothetical protein
MGYCFNHIMNTVPQNGKDVSSPRKDMPQPQQSFFQGISQRIAMAPFWALGDFAELVARV